MIHQAWQDEWEETRDWEAAWAEWVAELGGYEETFRTREWLAAYLQGLLGGVERITQLLAVGGSLGVRPIPMVQHLLGRAQWDADGCGMLARAQVIHALADAEGVLIVDKTGFLKRAAIPPGYSANTVIGMAGRIGEQVGVFSGYASCWGQG